MDAHRTRGLPPKLGIKKRKPRASAVIDVANGRARKDAPAAAAAAAAATAGGTPPAGAARSPHPGGSRGVAHLSKQQQTAAAKAATRAAAAANNADADVKRKGLRHFAVRVSRKVEEKSVTTYNEVADELVVEEKEIKQQEVEAGGKVAAALQKKLAKSGSLVDEKNIRRRVYDSLNVLMAMGIIEKDKKLISWRGLAMARGGGGHREAAATRLAIEERRRSLEQKRAVFVELEDQATTLAALIRRNAKAPAKLPRAADAAEPSLLPPGDRAAAPAEGGAGRGDDPKLGAKREVGMADDEPAAASTLALPPATADKPGDPLPLEQPPAKSAAPTDAPAGASPTTASQASASKSGPGGLDASASTTVAPPVAAGLPSHFAIPDRIPIPFIIVATGEDSQIELEMDQMREDVSFTFSSAFAVFDDREVLRRMNIAATLSQG